MQKQLLSLETYVAGQIKILLMSIVFIVISLIIVSFFYSIPVQSALLFILLYAQGMNIYILFQAKKGLVQKTMELKSLSYESLQFFWFWNLFVTLWLYTSTILSLFS